MTPPAPSFWNLLPRDIYSARLLPHSPEAFADYPMGSASPPQPGAFESSSPAYFSRDTHQLTPGSQGSLGGSASADNLKVPGDPGVAPFAADPTGLPTGPQRPRRGLVDGREASPF